MGIIINWIYCYITDFGYDDGKNEEWLKNAMSNINRKKCSARKG